MIDHKIISLRRKFYWPASTCLYMAAACSSPGIRPRLAIDKKTPRHGSQGQDRHEQSRNGQISCGARGDSPRLVREARGWRRYPSLRHGRPRGIRALEKPVILGPTDPVPARSSHCQVVRQLYLRNACFRPTLTGATFMDLEGNVSQPHASDRGFS